MTLSKDVLQKIKECHVEPKARWKFAVCEYGIWILGGSLIVVSGTLLSLVLYILAVNDWDAYQAFSGNLATFTIKTFPHALAILFLLMVAFTVFVVRHTKRGYKHSGIIIISFGVGVSAILASVLYVAGTPKQLDSVFTKKMPGYVRIVHPKVERWHHPENGVVAGRVVEIKTEQFHLIGKDGREWIVTVSSTRNITPDVVLRVVGKPVDEKTIEAKYVLPWERPPKFMRLHKDKKHMHERNVFPVRSN